MDTYVPLWCKSHYSFLEGASHPEELVKTAHALGLPALALTDRDGVYGVVKAHVKACELSLKLLVGAQVSVDDGSRILLLAQTRAGYAHLCSLLTVGRLRAPKGESRVTWSEVCAHTGDLLALWGGAGSLLVDEAEPDTVAEALREAFGDRLYALVARHREDAEVRAEQRLRARAQRYALPLVAAHEVLYHMPARRPLQDVLTCIRHGVTVHTAGQLTRPNDLHALYSPEAFARLFVDLPEAVARTREVAVRCTFSLADLRYRYPAERLPSGRSSLDWLRELTFTGARECYGGEVPENVAVQIERELDVIARLDYPGYFLTMYEIVRYCRANGVLCQGRGSAANSVVCYCLGITAIDPVKMNLLFERFLSMERAEPPDIDLDIQHDRREEVIQWVYEKYGRERAAMVANVIRYRSKSAVRDVGKALGLPETLLNRIGKTLDSYTHLAPEDLAHTGLDPAQPRHQHLVRLVSELQDFPRHLSIHPGGFLLGHEPVHTLVPIENATMPGRTVIQWDKDDCEALGLFKVDLLALGALTHLDQCFKLLRAHGLHRLPDGTEIGLAILPPDDTATYDMICRADVIGVFQIESRAQMAMLPRLRPREFYDLVVEISIVRPGPIVGGMVHPYLRRRRGQESLTFPHESLKPVLAKTLGIPLFQEQVLKLAVVAADYTPGEADQLRRDMAAWRRSGRIEQHHDRFVTRMQAKGIAREFAEAVFNQVKGFGEYGFPESHAASFALIAYASAWLRCHHLPVFICGLLNAWPMGFYHPATIVEDARRHGVEMRPLDVHHSDWLCTLESTQPVAGVMSEHPFAVRMGLRYVKGLSKANGMRIGQIRETAPFIDVSDFVARTGLDEKTLLRLAEAGALDGLVQNRRTALWAVRGVARQSRSSLPLPAAERAPAFAPLDALDTIAWDRHHSHHSVRGHPLASLRPALRALGLLDAATINRLPHGHRVRYGGLVINRQHPGSANGVTFMTLEDETGWVNLVVWEAVFRAQHVLARTANLLGVIGTVQSQEGVVHLVVEQFWEPELSHDAAPVPSRDFR
ncbi:MAG TPA: error-prone DNA polymerase [bacterium]|nr:error-prone DNA polymerase [bacterium]